MSQVNLWKVMPFRIEASVSRTASRSDQHQHQRLQRLLYTSEWCDDVVITVGVGIIFRKPGPGQRWTISSGQLSKSAEISRESGSTSPFGFFAHLVQS